MFGALNLPDKPDREPAQVPDGLRVNLLELIFPPEAIGLHRLLIAETVRTLQLRNIFREFGPQKTYRFLTGYLASRNRAGTLMLKAPVPSAALFLETLKGEYCIRAWLGEEIALSAR